VLRAIVNSLIPEDKKAKVEFVAEKDIPKVMRGLCEPHQLEEQYGGTAPNVKDGEAYPYRFFPNCTGKSWEVFGQAGETTLHSFVDRNFHTGHCWNLYPAERAKWEGEACQQSLTRESAKALGELLGVKAEPCTSLEQWKAWSPTKQDTSPVSLSASLAAAAAAGDEPTESIPMGFPDSKLSENSASQAQAVDAEVKLASDVSKMDAPATKGFGPALVETCDDDDHLAISNRMNAVTMDNTMAPEQTVCGIWSCARA